MKNTNFLIIPLLCCFFSVAKINGEISLSFLWIWSPVWLPGVAVLFLIALGKLLKK